MNSDTEQWLPMEGYPGYEVSSYGRIRGPRGIRKPHLHLGYLRIRILGKPVHIHVEVCKVFHGPKPFPGAIVLHGPIQDKTNCRSDNLRWGTPKENTADMMAVGNPKGQFKCGTSHFLSRLTPEAVKDIRTKAAEGITQKVLMQKYGISQAAVSNIIHRKTYTEVL